MAHLVAYPAAFLAGAALGVFVGRRVPHRVHVWLHRTKE